RELARRQHGYGRGGRMKIEQDRVEILSGVRHGRTLGSPISMTIANRDWANWQKPMAIEPLDLDDAEAKRVTGPRPGHADLAGALKYAATDARDILERASARETTARVAVGAVCRRFLSEFGVRIGSHVVELGDIVARRPEAFPADINAAADASPLRTLDADAERRMIERIDS